MTKNKYLNLIGYVFLIILVGFGIFFFVKTNFKKSKLIKMSSESIILYAGDSYPLEGEYTKDDGTTAKIVYSINNTSVATIDRETGVVIAKKPGKATLLASVEDDSSIYGECKIQVLNPSNSKIISNTSKITLNTSETGRASISTGNVDPSRITYKSYDEKIVKVDNNGVISAVGEGSTKIAIIVDGKEQTNTDVVVDNSKTNNSSNKTNTNSSKPKTTTVSVTSVTVNKSTVKLDEGKSAKVEVIVSPTNATNKTVTWSSSNTKVATVDQNGNIKAIKAGSAVISVVSNDNKKAATVNVTVKKVSTTPANNNTSTNSNTNGTFSVLATDKGFKLINPRHANQYHLVVKNTVLDYGADSTGSKDSSDAFQAAINAACPGGSIFIPAGTYLIKKSITVPGNCGVYGDLKQGTASGTIIKIQFGKGTTDIKQAAFKVGTQATIKNIAFWYPDQGVNANGYVNPYPPTISQTGIEGLTIDNVYFVNSYIAMDFASDHENTSIQRVSNVYGAPFTGIINDVNLDTIRMSNINFKAEYWTNANVSNTPSLNEIKTALKNKGVGVILERVDWYFIAGLNIDNYNVGLHLRQSINRGYSRTGYPEGELYASSITNCNYPIYAQKNNHMAITGSTLSSTNSNIGAIHYAGNQTTNLSVNSSTITGANAVVNQGNVNMSFTGSKLSGNIHRTNQTSKYSFINDDLTQSNYNGSSISDNCKNPSTINYAKTYTTKPTANKLIVTSTKTNNDITSELKMAINSLKSTGGIVYIPSGTYYLSEHIDVYSGIEVRGATPWAHNTNMSGASILKPKFNNNTVFTLYSKAGLNGLTISYDNQNITSYPYTIEGNGSNIYIMNIALPNAWKGIDLASHRCDNHYVENIWAEFINTGINIGGGSQNGIIKNCHITPNILTHTDDNVWRRNWKYIQENQIAYQIGSSTNELLVHNFVYGANIGYNLINGANNFVMLGNGADAANSYSLHMEGNVNGTIVNLMATVLATTKTLDVQIDKDPTTRNYIKSEANTSGYVNIVNLMGWSNGNKASAFNISGNNLDLHLLGGIVDYSASPILKDSAAALSVFGMIFVPSASTTYELNPGVKGFHAAGNICPGYLCGSRVSNNSGVNYSINNNGIK